MDLEETGNWKDHLFPLYGKAGLLWISAKLSYLSKESWCRNNMTGKGEKTSIAFGGELSLLPANIQILHPFHPLKISFGD